MYYLDLFSTMSCDIKNFIEAPEQSFRGSWEWFAKQLEFCVYDFP